MSHSATLAAGCLAGLIAVMPAKGDVVVSIPGTHVFTGGGGHTVTVPGLTGTLTGIRVSFTYRNAANESWASDIAFTVSANQWGGYYPFINGASIGQSPTGAPDSGNDTTFTSGNLGMGYAVSVVNQPLVVGFGNGYLLGHCTVSDVTVTLLGLIPTPGAAAALGLGGLAACRRRR